MNFVQRFTFLFRTRFEAKDLEGLRVAEIVTAIQRMGYQVIRAPRIEDAEIAVACRFRQVGYLPSVAYKFGQWADMIMTQRSLGSLGSGGTTASDVWPAVTPDEGGQ